MDIERENQIRDLSLRLSRKDIVKFLLTKDQRDVLFKISHHGITTPELAKKLNTSSQNANMKLKKLVDMGYLTREVIPDPSGGYMYRFEKTPQVMSRIRSESIDSLTQ